jgi:hypothetical protein
VRDFEVIHDMHESGPQLIFDQMKNNITSVKGEKG